MFTLELHCTPVSDFMKTMSFYMLYNPVLSVIRQAINEHYPVCVIFKTTSINPHVENDYRYISYKSQKVFI